MPRRSSRARPVRSVAAQAGAVGDKGKWSSKMRSRLTPACASSASCSPPARKCCRWLAPMPPRRAGRPRCRDGRETPSAARGNPAVRWAAGGKLPHVKQGHVRAWAKCRDALYHLLEAGVGGVRELPGDALVHARLPMRQVEDHSIQRRLAVRDSLGHQPQWGSHCVAPESIAWGGAGDGPDGAASRRWARWCGQPAPPARGIAR